MLFYMEKKDKVARENPGLEMVNIDFYDISEIYLALCLTNIYDHLLGPNIPH